MKLTITVYRIYKEWADTKPALTQALCTECRCNVNLRKRGYKNATATAKQAANCAVCGN